MKNVEYKAELRDPDLARVICAGLQAAPIGLLEQTDTYYDLADDPTARLKLRQSPGERDEFIFYRRPDDLLAKVSHFELLSTVAAKVRFDPDKLPIRVVVRKRRDLYMLGSVRIHLDVVEHLGHFFELEAMVTPSQGIEQCRTRVDDLRARFAPALGEPMASSYSDLLEAHPDVRESRRES
ncbi:MAG: class IV adenylate cyclase [Phycisphaeraceae bacterium]|nr:class IV adenylate cyclase [Phycisphaeraceae bacterium]